MRIRSHCTGHFPAVRFHEGKRLLRHPVSGRLLADRPEERVRLRSLDFLLANGLWPPGHIATETGASTQGAVKAGRVDVLLYNRELRPEVLIECKAPTVGLTEATGRQIARYNADVGAGLLCLTNGLVDFWYRVDEAGIVPLAGLPQALTPSAAFSPDWSYWEAAGFAGHHSGGIPAVGRLLERWFQGVAAENLICLNPGLAGTAAGFPHYYQVVQESGAPLKLAFTVAADATGKTTLTAIRNVNGRNEAVLFLRLDAVYLQGETTYRLMRSSADSEHPVPGHWVSYLTESDDDFRRLPVMIDDLFTL